MKIHEIAADLFKRLADTPRDHVDIIASLIVGAIDEAAKQERDACAQIADAAALGVSRRKSMKASHVAKCIADDIRLRERL